MPLVTVLRVLIAAVILFPILAIAIDALAPGLLPPELAAYSESELESPMRPLEYIYLGLAAPLLASTVGLWLLKPWARWLYTAVTAAIFLLGPFGPPWIGSSVAAMLNDLANLCDGAILALIWLSDLRKELKA